MAVETTIIVLLFAATAVAMLVQRLRVPYTVALVLVGLAFGTAPQVVPGVDLDVLRLTPDTLFGIFLPALLFEAAFHLSWHQFKKNARSILLLAVPGLAIAIAVAGLFTYALAPIANTSLPLLVAFLFVAMCAATDPVSVIALFKEMGVPKRLAVLMEGESLLNDGVAVVAFIALSAILGLSHTGETVDAAWVAQFFLWEVAGGLGLGILIGLLASWLTTLVEDHLIEIMLTTLAAFGSYVVADAVHASFVLAVVGAGMACGNVGARYGMTGTNRIAVESFWEYAAFVVNSLVFLLLGKEIELSRLAAHVGPIVLAWAVLMAARGLVIGLVSLVLKRTRERLPARWPAVLAWGGLRGSLSMVLALTLPEDFAYRDLLVDLTFGVVLLSLLFQGVTMAPLLKWSGAVQGGPQHPRYERLRGALRASRAALRALDGQLQRDEIHQGTYDALRQRLTGRLAELEEGLEQLEPELESVKRNEIERSHAQLLEVEREAIETAMKKGALGREAGEELLEELEHRQVALEADPPGAG